MKKRYILKNKRKFITFLTIVILVAFTAAYATTAYGYKEPSYKLIEVRSGDTLWGIAKQFNKNSDIREFIYEIKKINNLTSSDIYAGNIIKVPVE